jgi:tetratricopeptide (TPR) repeat protein
MQASMVYQVEGDFGKAIAAMEESIRAGDQGGFGLASTAMRFSLGLVYGYLGDLKQAEHWLQDSVTASQNDTSLHPMTGAGMVHLAIWKNDLESAQRYLDAMRPSALGAPKNPQTDYWMHLSDANLACARQDWHRAIAAADELIAMLNIVISQILLAQAYEIKGRALLALGQLEQADATLSTGRDQAIRFRERRILWEIYADWSELETRRGNSAQAGEWKLLARQTLDEIIATIPTPELKESFLQMPRVRALRT